MPRRYIPAEPVTIYCVTCGQPYQTTRPHNRRYCASPKCRTVRVKPKPTVPDVLHPERMYSSEEERRKLREHYRALGKKCPRYILEAV